MSPIAFNRELRAGCGIDELRDFAVPAELRNLKRSQYVHSDNIGNILKRRSDAGVFSQVINDVRRFRNNGVDIFGMAAPVFGSRNVIGFAAVRVIVE